MAQLDVFKNELLIPKDTVYCYDYLGVDLRIRICPYFEHIEDEIGYCTLIESDVIDQTKSCGISEGDFEC